MAQKNPDNVYGERRKMGNRPVGSPEPITDLKRELLMKRKIVRGLNAVEKAITQEDMTPLYAFYYRSITATDYFPIILLIDARDSLDGARFRYPPFQKASARPGKKPRPSQAKGDTYIAGIRLDTLGPITLMNIMERFGGRKSINLREAETLQLFTKEGYRIYDTRKMREFSYIPTEELLNVQFAPWSPQAGATAKGTLQRRGRT